MTTMAIDPAIIELMNHLSRPQPAIVQPFFDVQGETDRFRRESFRTIDRASREFEAWVAEGLSVRERLWRLVAQNSPSKGGADDYARIIEAIEKRCASSAKRLAQLRKLLSRQEKEASTISAEASQVLQETGGALLAYLQREIDELIDFGLFLRALRAEMNPASRGGKTFDDPGDLRKHLDRALT